MQAIGTVQIEDERFRVTEWRFAPGASTGWHRHAHDYVVVPLTTGTLRIVSAEGEQGVQLVAGASYTRLAGVEHDVVNASAAEFAFIEVERL